MGIPCYAVTRGNGEIYAAGRSMTAAVKSSLVLLAGSWKLLAG